MSKVIDATNRFRPVDELDIANARLTDINDAISQLAYSSYAWHRSRGWSHEKLAAVMQDAEAMRERYEGRQK